MGKVLVTGGEGFVGSHLIGALLEGGHEVVSLDNGWNSIPGRQIEGVEYFSGATAEIGKLFENRHFDTVFHFGEYARVEQSRQQDDRKWVFDLNVVGTFEVVEFCTQKQCRLVYAASSTAFVNGVGTQGRNLTPYTFWKDVNARLIQNYGEWYGLDYALAYLYNAYGPGETSTGKYSTLIGIFLENARSGKPMPVTRPGTQRRNFTHVADIVDGLCLLVESREVRAEERVYRFGAKEHYSVLEVVALVGGKIEWLPEKPGNREQIDTEVTGEIAALNWKASRRLLEYVAAEMLRLT